MFKVIAHDLRGPVGAISQAMNIMKELAKEEDLERIIEFSNLLETQGKTTLETLENLLQWSQSQNIRSFSL